MVTDCVWVRFARTIFFGRRVNDRRCTVGEPRQVHTVFLAIERLDVPVLVRATYRPVRLLYS